MICFLVGSIFKMAHPNDVVGDIADTHSKAYEDGSAALTSPIQQPILVLSIDSSDDELGAHDGDDAELTEDDVRVSLHEQGISFGSLGK